MKKLITTVCLLLLSGNALLAEIIVRGKREMIAQSDLIALVDIQELANTDKSRVYADLIATGYVAKAFKGNARGEISFRIHRFAPCGTFDVSTGRHLIFLKMDDSDEYVGVNWYMSYLYLGGKTTQWYDENGAINDGFAPEAVVNDTENLVKESLNKSLKATP